MKKYRSSFFKAFTAAAMLAWGTLGLCAYVQAQTQAGEKEPFTIDPENSLILLDTTQQNAETENALRYIKNKMTAVNNMQKYELRDSSERLTRYEEFLASFDSVRSADLETKLEAINRTVNALIKGQPEEDTDIWQTPCVSVIEKKGDCEDYAILKREACLYLGLDPRRVFIGLVATHHSESINHAVVYYDASPKKDFRQVYVLDNLELVVKSAGDQDSRIEYVIRSFDGDTEAHVASRNNKVEKTGPLAQGPG